MESNTVRPRGILTRRPFRKPFVPNIPHALFHGGCEVGRAPCWPNVGQCWQTLTNFGANVTDNGWGVQSVGRMWWKPNDFTMGAENVVPSLCFSLCVSISVKAAPNLRSWRPPTGSAEPTTRSAEPAIASAEPWLSHPWGRRSRFWGRRSRLWHGVGGPMRGSGAGCRAADPTNEGARPPPPTPALTNAPDVHLPLPHKPMHVFGHIGEHRPMIDHHRSAR